MPKDIVFSEPIDNAIVELVNIIPTKWQVFEYDSFSSTQQEALKFLTGAGIVEQRCKMRLRMIGEPQVIFLTFRMTGEYGMVEVVEKIAAAVANWRNPEGKIKNQILSERDPELQIRLTDQGELAKKDIVDGQYMRVVDFAKKTGFFTDRPAVRGQGIVESLEIKDTCATAGPVAIAQAQANIGDININNNIDTTAIAAAVGAAIEKLGVLFQNKDTQIKAPARKSPKSNDVAKRSWTMEELEEAIQDYRAKRASTLYELVSILDDKNTTRPKKLLARRNAIKLFGRNPVARALGVKSAKMVGETKAWKALAGILGLPRKVDDVTRKDSIDNESEDEPAQAAIPRSAATPYSDDNLSVMPEDALIQKEREETLKYIRQLATSLRKGARDHAKALLRAYDEGEMTDEQIRQTVTSLLRE